MDAGDHGAELSRLERRTPGELGAGEARRKAEVVLYPRARARLTARGEALDHERAEALGGGVDRRGEPGRTAAEHDDVEGLAVDLGSQAQLGGDRLHGGVADDAVRADQDRALRGPDAEPFEQGPALVVGVQVVPRERNEVALQEPAAGESISRPPRAD